MKLTLAVAIAGVALAAAKPRWHELDGYSFEDYKKDFNKRYDSPSEHAHRRSIFERNMRVINSHNADNTKTWKNGVSHLTDWTTAEFKKMLGYHKGYGFSMHRPTEPETNVDLSALPDSVDWRDKGVITNVKDQGQCGSCWTFASTETLESHVAIKTGIVEVLSEQNILDCTPNPQHCGGTGGCQGGTAELAYTQLAANGGMQTEWTYPYVSWHGQNFDCKFDKKYSVMNVTGHVKLPSNQYQPLMDAVANVGPISVSVEASHWQHYETGVFNGCNQTNPDIDHLVQLVGYGKETDGTGYWLIRNSWTPHWGENGYIKLMRTDNEQGRCGQDITPEDGSGCTGGPSVCYCVRYLRYSFRQRLPASASLRQAF